MPRHSLLLSYFLLCPTGKCPRRSLRAANASFCPKLLGRKGLGINLLKGQKQCDSEGEAMCLSQSMRPVEPAVFGSAENASTAQQWFAVQTRSKHEKAVAQQISERGIATFLPLVRTMHRWSDRRKAVDLPLFSCYVFVRLMPTGDQRSRVLRVDGVLSFVGSRGVGMPIPEEQIHAVQILLQEKIPYSCYPFLKIGQRVRIRSGALNGVEGILTARSGERSLIISLDTIQRSLSVRIEGYDVEAL